MAETNSGYTEVHKALVNMEFSRNASLDQLVTDWPRRAQRVRIDGLSFDKFLKAQGITENPAEIDSSIIKEKLKDFLLPLIPVSQRTGNLDAQYNKLATVLHQGGLPSLLEKEIVESLNNREQMLKSVRDGTSRWIDLTPTDTGFKVVSSFQYKGNIVSKDDPDEITYKQETSTDPVSGLEAQPMLVGHSEFDVILTKDKVKPDLGSFQIQSSNPTLNKLFDAAPEFTAIDKVTVRQSAGTTARTIADYKHSLEIIITDYKGSSAGDEIPEPTNSPKTP